MRGFVDETSLEVGSGKGGAGCVSLRREKYIPKGGPDGGDGGKGGDVIFQIKRNLRTLAHLRFKRIINAGNGRPGEGRKKHAIRGDDGDGRSGGAFNMDTAFREGPESFRRYARTLWMECAKRN